MSDIETTKTNPTTQSREAQFVAYRALATAQANFLPIEKNCLNNHTGKRYADLSSVLNSVRPALLAAGFALSDSADVSWAADLSHGTVRVTTRLVHASGGVLEGVVVVPILPQPRRRKGSDEEETPGASARISAQAIGVAITYGRRYGLQTIAGVAPDEDSDGELEHGGKKPGQAVQKALDDARRRPASSTPATRAPRAQGAPTLEQLKALTAEELEAGIEKGEETLQATAPEDPRRQRMVERLDAYKAEKTRRFESAFDQRPPLGTDVPADA